MIVWGGIGCTDYECTDDDAYLITGGRYNPVTNSWTSTSITEVPEGREFATVVWSGNEMIIWGGLIFDIFNQPQLLDTGGRYNPTTDTWVATTTVGAPDARWKHTAVWANDLEIPQMLLWGGEDSDQEYLITGGGYDPVNNSWDSFGAGSTAPKKRVYHTAVWTGAEMIIWGGDSDELYQFIENSGGKFDPTVYDPYYGWTLMRGIPTARIGHTAVYTGAEIIIWGGNATSSGYNSGYQNTRSKI